MTRIRWSAQRGTLTADISDSDATIESAELIDFPEITAPDYAVVILDPTGLSGTPEIAYITAHAASADSATVTRGEETSTGGAAARAHLSGTFWRHGPTPEDFVVTALPDGWRVAFSDVDGGSFSLLVDDVPVLVDQGWVPDVLTGPISFDVGSGLGFMFGGRDFAGDMAEFYVTFPGGGVLTVDASSLTGGDPVVDVTAVSAFEASMVTAGYLGGLVDRMVTFAPTDEVSGDVDLADAVNRGGRVRRLLVTGNVTSVANPSPLTEFVLVVVQDGTGGWDVDFGDGWDWPGGAPSFPTAAGAVSVVYAVQDYTVPVQAFLLGSAGGGVPDTRTVSAGTGLTGGGDLSADRTISADFGTGAGKVVEGNNAALTDARVPTAAGLAATTTAATGKTTPVDADELPIADSAASYGLKKLTWANLKATLKTYFDTLYVPTSTVIPWSSRIDLPGHSQPGVVTGSWSIASQNGPSGTIATSAATNDQSWTWRDLTTRSGTWTLDFWVRGQTNGGIITVTLGGIACGAVDCYASGTTPNTLVQLTGIVLPTSGYRDLVFTNATKNASASNYQIPLQALTLRRTGA